MYKNIFVSLDIEGRFSLLDLLSPFYQCMIFYYFYKNAHIIHIFSFCSSFQVCHSFTFTFMIYSINLKYLFRCACVCAYNEIFADMCSKKHYNLCIGLLCVYVNTERYSSVKNTFCVDHITHTHTQIDLTNDYICLYIYIYI